LIVLGEGDRDLAVSQRPCRGWLHREYFTQGQLLFTLGGESAVSTKDDVDDVLRILEVLGPQLVTGFIILLVFSLSCMREGQCIECFADGDALKQCVPLLRVYREASSSSLSFRFPA
jgi:hypothetical protein